MLKVLAVENRADGAERRGDDQPVIDGEAVSLGDVEPEIETAMLARYRAATGAGDDFVAAYRVLGAQRNAKIIGIFTRLWKRDGKPRYPTMCPRVWRYLEADLAAPELSQVKAWFDAEVPAELRGDPMEIGPK